ncbi:hypothetical protein V8F20_006334 [Naviculisporaceae sp. PSN 640]
MSPISESNIRSSSEAAEAFVTWYYDAINKGKPISSGYVNANKTYMAAQHPPADLIINGRQLSTPEEWEKLLEQQRTPQLVLSPPSSTTTNITNINISKEDKPPTNLVQYTPESYDTHIINADYTFACPPDLAKKYSKNAGVRMMLTVTVSGRVSFGPDKEAPKQTFHDSFVLVPNWEVIARAGSKATRRYIVVSQTYRAF